MSDENQQTEERYFIITIDSDNDDDKMSFKSRVDGATMAKVMQMIYAGQDGRYEVSPPAVDKTTTSEDGSPVEGRPELSFAEFLDEVAPENNFQRIAAIALYRRDYLGEDLVTRDELPRWFQKAGRPAPKNISRDIRWALKRGLVAEDPQQDDHYYVTKKGVDRLRSSEES